MNYPAPIALFVYARPEHTAKTLEALRRNTMAAESDLVVFSDGARGGADRANVAAVRELVNRVTGFRSITVVERPRNVGLAKNIIDGVTQVCEARGAVIVLEDDLVSTSHFLRYMNDGLQIYEATTRVASIHSYMFPMATPLPETFFLRGADCWGWATWKRAWDFFNPNAAELLRRLESSGLQKEFDFGGYYPYSEQLRRQAEGRSDTWAARWYASAFLADMLTLHPCRSLVHHLGADGSGTNVRYTSSMDVQLTERPINVIRQDAFESTYARNALVGNFRRMKYLRPWHVAVGFARAVINKAR